jgi:hypothetical protein
MTRKSEQDGSLTVALWGVGVVGLLASVVSLSNFGLSVAAGVMLGALLALSNLWVHARVVKMYLAGGGPVWAVIGLVKVTLLFGVVYLMVRRELVDLFPLVAGYASLPAGILVSHLRPVPSPTLEER